MYADMWPHSIRYATHALNIHHPAVGVEGSRFLNAVGSEFSGRQLQLGQLVYYRMDSIDRAKFRWHAPSCALSWATLGCVPQ